MMGGISPNVPSGYTVPPRYFPNAAELSNATAIEIVSGGDLHGIDFVVDRQPLRRIRGRVVDAAAGGGPAAAKIQLVTRWMTGGTSSRGDHRSYNPADGTFELADVPYGIHEVVVEVTASGTPAPRRTPPLVPAGSGRVGVIYIGVRPRELVTAGARVPVMVGNSDIENMVVTLGAGRALSGRLSIDGPPRGVNGLSVHLTPSSNGRMISYTQGPALATVALDGTFKFEHVLPGEYRVQLDGLEPDST
jgi:hypothetical protein